MCLVGLRIDVDTLRGTRIGVPRLVALLAEHQIRASFFFSVGPDNMGRHLWRLIRPAFLAKMLRTRATRLYGWEILLQGTLWPGPVIGERCAEVIRKAGDGGHEIGLHAWDHHRWQMKLERLDADAIARDLHKGFRMIETILGKPPECFAAPGWRLTRTAHEVLEGFPFRYRSDCRGYSLFRPVMGGRVSDCIQVPVTLPTYDEAVGIDCSAETFGDLLLDRIPKTPIPVVTIHAEVEGIACWKLFETFLAKAEQQGIRFLPLGDLVNRNLAVPPTASIERAFLPGREGWIAFQSPTPLSSSIPPGSMS